MLDETYRVRQSVGEPLDPNLFEAFGERYVAVRVRVGDEPSEGDERDEEEEW